MQFTCASAQHCNITSLCGRSLADGARVARSHGLIDHADGDDQKDNNAMLQNDHDHVRTNTSMFLLKGRYPLNNCFVSCLRPCQLALMDD